MVSLQHHMTYIGPNIFSKKPIIVIRISFTPLDLESAEKRLSQIEKHCKGWFKPKPLTNEPLAHEVAAFLGDFAAAVLSKQNGKIDCYGVYQRENDLFILLGYHDPQTSLEALQIVTTVFSNLDELSTFEIDQMLEQFWGKCEIVHPDYQIQFLIDYAEHNDIPVRRLIGGLRQWIFGLGKHAKTYFESSPLKDSFAGVSWSGNKHISKLIMAEIGAPLASHFMVHSQTDLETGIKYIGFPCVIKPIDRGRSIGVHIGINDKEALMEAYKDARKESHKPIMLEKEIPGQIYRIIVIRQKLWCAIKREPAFIIADGQKTVHELTKDYNQTLEGQTGFGDFLGPVPFDKEFEAALNEQGFSQDDRPQKSEKIYVQQVPLLSKGAIYSDVSDRIHPDIVQISNALAGRFGIYSCGLDYMTADISKSFHEIDSGFIEINATPGLRVPLMAGRNPSEIASVMLEGKPATIPTTLVITPTENHDRFRNDLVKDDTTGWVTLDKGGVGETEFDFGKRDYTAILGAVLVNPLCTEIVCINDLDIILRHGLPLEHIDTIIIDKNYQLNPAWQRVLEKSSTQIKVIN